LPFSQAFTQNALGICWRDCASTVSTVTGKWTNINILPGQTPSCGEKRMRLDIVNGSNVLMWRGPMRLQYSRTWLVTDSSGLLNQVWRFLVNGDLTRYPAAGPQPCPVPPCPVSAPEVD
ncbi:MAG: hypothetical protein HC849_13130, partial [Oscillatoriales cyanobacterium RU_3_3]|nr:hypothetical protein [Oscillatoriales cyanobacterium RU_3_3]